MLNDDIKDDKMTTPATSIGAFMNIKYVAELIGFQTTIEGFVNTVKLHSEKRVIDYRLVLNNGHVIVVTPRDISLTAEYDGTPEFFTMEPERSQTWGELMEYIIKKMEA